MYRVIKAASVEPIRRYAVEFTAMLKEPCDPDYYLKRWEVFIKTGVGHMWYLEHDGAPVGGIGGIVAPDILSGKGTLIELFWYVTPNHRSHGILLFNTMESYVTSNHLRWAMVHMEQSMPTKLKHFYIRKGFRLLETHWIKDIKEGD